MMKNFFHSKYFLTAVLAFVCVLAGSERGYAKNHAVIIGVSQNPDVVNNTRNLPWCYNDAVQIAGILGNSYEITLLTQKPENDSEKTTNFPEMPKSVKMAEPTKENIIAALHKFTAKKYFNSKNNDTLLVYFSGHGHNFDNSQDPMTYLVASDTVVLLDDDGIPQPQEETFITAKEIRDIMSQSPAAHKILLLDACYSGGTRDASSENKITINPNDFAQGNADVLTFTSSTINQTSSVWEDQRMSTFSYWLHQGLLGFADENADGEVSTLEIFCYIRDNMKQVKIREEAQDPQVVYKSFDELENVNFSILFAEEMDENKILNAFANQIAARLQEKQLQKVYFKNLAPSIAAKGSVPKAEEETKTRSFNQYASNELKNKLNQKYVMINYQSNKIEAVDQNTAANEDLEGAVLTNNLVYHSDVDSNPYYEVTCELSFPKSINGANNSDESVTLHNIVRAHKTHETINHEFQSQESVQIPINANDPSETAEFVVPAISFDVFKDGYFMEKRFPMSDRNGTLWLALNAGESYQIHINYSVPYQYSLNGELGLRLLVDGKNTLPDTPPASDAKFIIFSSIEGNDPNNSAADTPPSSEAFAAQTTITSNAASVPQPERRQDAAPNAPVLSQGVSVRLDNARGWVLSKHQESAILGFYDDRRLNPDGSASYNRFEAAPFDGNIAPGENLDQIGLIQAAFYSLINSRDASGRDVRTIEGEIGRQKLNYRYNVSFSREPLGVVNIRYASQSALDRYFKEQGIGRQNVPQPPVNAQQTAAPQTPVPPLGSQGPTASQGASPSFPNSAHGVETYKNIKKSR